MLNWYNIGDKIGMLKEKYFCRSDVLYYKSKRLLYVLKYIVLFMIMTIAS